ncbi:AAA family ATPase [Paraburkholderia caledonica]|uniref:AAA family ATPase n=1 Tax=Paraburkholderia caledonica TaxID=134536 RepID=UPI000B403AE5|nr:AAA family ATPase [Paraburkholderia caledonica]
MLIEKFYVPGDEATQRGLKEINMSRLGRYVALAGKNGAGKSRILDALEAYVQIRMRGVGQQLLVRRQSIEGYENNIRNQPESQYVQGWKNALREECKQIELTLGRVVCDERIDLFKAIRFVPKQLNLQDPRSALMSELAARSGNARSPGVSSFGESCLFYIQQVQNRWWNADHQRYSGPSADKISALQDYESLLEIIERFLGVVLGRNLDGIATMYDKPIPDAGLSDGQKVILQLSVALHAQRADLDNTVFLLDEPENHLHPSAVIDLLRALHDASISSQIWIATHSVPLLAFVSSADPMSVWYVEDGAVTHAGRKPQLVLGSLLGDEDRVAQLNSFTSLPAQLAAINYANESLLPPKVLTRGERDPQVTQIQRVVSALGSGSPLAVLDVGAGKGRLLDGMAEEFAAQGSRPSDFVDYFAFDLFDDDRVVCEQVIQRHFPDGGRRYFGSREQFFEHKEDQSISVVVMCNVLHEIPPHAWLELFSPQSLVYRSLKDDGYLLLVEDQRIPVGEKAHQHGFLVLDTSHLRTLFAVTEHDTAANRFCVDDARNDGRLKAHLIAKSLLARITGETRRSALLQLQETAKETSKS